MTPAEIEDFHREVLDPICAAFEGRLLGFHQGDQDLEFQARLAEAFAEVETRLAELKFRKLLEVQAMPRERPGRPARGRSLNIDCTLAAALMTAAGAAFWAGLGWVPMAAYLAGVTTAFIADMICNQRGEPR